MRVIGKCIERPDKFVHCAIQAADYAPVSWHSVAVWVLPQTKCWGYVKGKVNYTQLAEEYS